MENSILKVKRGLILLGALAGILPVASAAMREVGPGKAYSTIQSAISDAVEGEDEVVVYDGTYEISDALVLDKGITVRSVNGAESTIVKRVNTSTATSGTHVERVLQIDAPDAVFQGLTLTGGRVVKNDGDMSSTSYEGAGAGVRIGTRGGLLSECIVSNNLQVSGVCYGGGVAVLGSAGKISRCLITRNTDAHGSDIKGYGFGIYMLGGEVVDSEISYNVENCTYARGSVLLKGNATMRRCKVVGNTALNAKYYDWGTDWQATAGVYVMTGGALIENCLIAENVSKLGTSLCGSGGGLAIDSVEAEIVNCTIAGNTAGVGGGVWTKSTKAKFVNCLIQGNTADQDADFKGASTVVAKNCICNVDFTNVGSSGNQKDRVGFKDGTYEPLANQATYDKGTVEGYDWLKTTVDVGGNDRIAFEAIDVGCYEYHLAGYEVNISATPSETSVFQGTPVRYSADIFPQPDEFTCSWKVDGEIVSSDAVYQLDCTDFVTHEVELIVTIGGVEQEPKRASVTGCPRQIYVLNSELHSEHRPSAPYASESTAAFSVGDALKYAIDGSVVIIGPGTYAEEDELVVDKDISLISVEGPVATVLRRSGGQTAGGVCRRILSINNSRACVSGLAIENGYGSDWSEQSWGPGVRLGASGGTVTNCVVRNCRLTAGQNAYGGGVYVAGGRMVDCVITNNELQVGDQTYLHGGGAGVCLTGGCLENCKIAGNRLVLTSVSGRRQIGAGVLLRAGCMTGCLVAQNISDGCGAGLGIESAISGGQAFVSNCTFVANVSAASVGGAIVTGIYPVSQFVNCCFANNRAAEGRMDLNIADVDMTATYCFGPAGELPEGEGNVFGTDAKFIGSRFVPSSESPLVDRGVFAGWMVGSCDLRGRPRVTDRGLVTIGCYQVDPRGLMMIFR